MSGALPRYYRPERAVAADESVSWVVVDEDLGLHAEACAYLAGVRGAGRAFNTEKTYAGRIALYLSYCQGYGVDWSSPSLAQLMADDAVAGGSADAAAVSQRGHRQRDHVRGRCGPGRAGVRPAAKAAELGWRVWRADLLGGCHRLAMLLAVDS
ncbi:hypothetical protein AB0J35_05035 [Nonomuraea angiospora]|uniref:hypothetical protein n=1 Tax=Nonomuraea angiospora TaxID=46172 RepID=UPI00341AE0B9